MTTRAPERRPLTLEDLAEHQDGVVSVEQAQLLGVTPGQIAWRRSSGRYRRCRRGVVRLAGVPASWRQAVRTHGPRFPSSGPRGRV